ncbi:hypothetical protein TURU_084002 [Turdus rufiventris]|nr:hypothetical protein TURU_084002 [Turdus rufiventris]
MGLRQATLAGDPLEDNPAQQARLPCDVLVDIKEAARKAILQIAPAANCNEELTVLAKALRPPLTIPENMRIAKAMALPPHPLGHQVMTVTDSDHPSYNDHVEVHDTWVRHIGCERHIIMCQLTYDEKTIDIKVLVDTGADVTLVSYVFWPREWT